MYKFTYTYNDIDYYLEAQKKIERQLDIYLIDRLDKNNNNNNNNNLVSSSYNNDNYDNSIISKFTEYDYEKDRYALKQLEAYKRYVKKSNKEVSKVLELRYTRNLSVKEISNKLYQSERTTQRQLKAVKQELYEIFNKNQEKL